MRTVRLRTKFLISLVAISAGLTAATLLIVGYNVQNGVRQSLHEDLNSSVNIYQSFAQQREAALERSAELLASLPNIRALMTTDAATIQDGIADVWRLSGSDLLVLADPQGTVVALTSSAPGLDPGEAQAILRRALDRRQARDWWFNDGQLYAVCIQPIYFGTTPTSAALGVLALGRAIDQRVAQDLSHVAASDITFHFGETLVASTLSEEQQVEAARQSPSMREFTADEPHEIELAGERFLTTKVQVAPESETPIYLSVFKSFDRASAFLRDLDRVLLGLGLLSVLAGSALVFFISDTFIKPLASLVEGVRALEKGDFDYPLGNSGGDEVSEVTGAFTRMRAAFRKAQAEQQQLEAKLRQAIKMEAVGRLAGGVAHDFNNLLTIIRGHSDLLLDGAAPNSPEARSAEQIRKASDRAVSLTRQLLAFSRMQVLQPRVLDLNAVVAELGKMLPRLIGEDIEYTFRPGPLLGRVKADPGQIEQVLMNLAVNARDAMPHGGKLTVETLNTTVSETEAAAHPPMLTGDYVLLSVSDTGHGMDEQTKSHIFEPFFTTKEVGKGTGLGLATVYGVVKQSGGFIWVQSAPGKGAAFHIYLPLVPQEAHEPEREAKRAAIPRGTETILLAEDEESVRTLACEFLRSSGYSVLEAENGHVALDIASRHSGPIDLLVSDMVMPRMSGATLVERIKVMLPNVKVVLMSGYAEFSFNQDNFSTQATAVLQKPFTRASLVEKVREALKGAPQPADVSAHGIS
jgi:signal transduction histidine kinase/ActR/RegA family two-component response regulator